MNKDAMSQRLLENKVALITGGAAGIGEAIAHFFGDEGAHVFVLDLNGKGAAAVADSIQKRGGSAFALSVDVRSSEEVRAAITDALERFHHIDILINNAGIYPRKAFLQMSEQEWDDVQETNLKGVFHCTKAVLPHMVERRSGKIVNISSVTFFKGFANLTHYVAAKGGVIGLTRSLAREVGPHNVYVNCITPGAIEVETEKLVATPEQIAAIVSQQSLQGRLKPLDVARVCLFLASYLSDGLTGQTINVDGGLIMH
jgi:3-oxoacyl-[acyl-carrier protein] reductase